MVKVKNRYYLIRLIPNDGSLPNVTRIQMFGEIARLAADMFGDFGYSIVKISLSIRVSDEDIMVIRIGSTAEKYFAAILPCILKVGSQPMVIQTIFIGRSMRSCEKRLIKIRRDELTAALGKCTSAATRSALLQTIKNTCGKPTRIFDDSEIRLQDLVYS